MMRGAWKPLATVLGCAAVVAVLVWVRPPRQAPAESDSPADKPAGAYSQFRDTWQADIRRVTATADPLDDLTLVARWLETAKQPDQPPEMVAVLCDNIYALAARTPHGQDAAMQAMALLADRVPERGPDARQRILQLLERHFNVTRGEQRQTIGVQLLDALIKAADDAVARGDFTQAGRHVVQADGVATQLRWPELLDPVEQRQTLIRDRQRATTRLGTFTARLEQNAWDADTINELIRLYLVEFDDHAAAMKLLKRGGSKEADVLVPLLTAKLDELDASICRRLGQWLTELATSRDTSTSGQIQTLTRARMYYQYYLEHHAEPGTSAVTVEHALRGIETRLRSLTEPARTKALARGRTVTIHWAAGDVADVYHNGRRLGDEAADPSNRQADRRAVHQVRTIIRRGDVFTVGLRTGGANAAFMLAAVDADKRLLWKTDTDRWKSYTPPPDNIHWQSPKLAIASKTADVTAGAQLTAGQQDMAARFGGGLRAVYTTGDGTVYLLSVVRSVEPIRDEADQQGGDANATNGISSRRLLPALGD